MLLQNVFKEGNSVSAPAPNSGDDPNSELQRVTRERNRLRDQLNKVPAMAQRFVWRIAMSLAE